MKRSLTMTLSLVLLASCTSPGPQKVSSSAEAGPRCDAPPVIPGPDQESLRLIAVGDAGLPPHSSLLRATLNGMKAVSGTDGVLLLGDNVYTCGLRDANDPNWTKVIAPLFEVGKPVYPVLGNHDWGRRALFTCGFSNPNAEIEKTGAPGFELLEVPGSQLRSPDPGGGDHRLRLHPNRARLGGGE